LPKIQAFNTYILLMFLKIILFLLAFMYISCTSQLVVVLPACSELNWFERGRQDGMQGQPSNNWFLKAKECDKMSPAEIQNYMDGWNHGLAMFCTEEHGFVTGRAGTAYKKTCPEKYEEDFLKGYEEGFSVYTMEKETAEIIAEMETMELQLKDSATSEDSKLALKKRVEALNEKKIGNLRALEKYNSALNR